MHVVGLAVPEDVPDLFAREHGRRRAAHVAGFQPVTLGLDEIDVDPDLRDVGLEFHVLLDHAVDAPEELAHLVRLGTQGLRVGPPKMRTTMASLDPGEDLIDPLVQVGLTVAEESPGSPR